MIPFCAGYEFAHRDDYEGRQVLPNLKVDADSRNIQELEIEKDPVSCIRTAVIIAVELFHRNAVFLHSIFFLYACTEH